MDEEMKAIEENRQREKFNSIPDAETYIGDGATSLGLRLLQIKNRLLIVV